MAIHSSTLAWRIPWREEPGRLQSMGSQRVGHDWATSLHFMHLYVLPSQLSWWRICLQCRRPRFDPWVGKIPWRRERLPTSVFWPGEFHGVCSPWGHKESDTTEQLSVTHSGTYMGFQVAQLVKNLPAMQETWVRSPGREDPLEKGMATHSSILAWEILWTQESGGLQSMGSSQRVGHDWATITHTHMHLHNHHAVQNIEHFHHSPKSPHAAFQSLLPHPLSWSFPCLDL